MRFLGHAVVIAVAFVAGALPGSATEPVPHEQKPPAHRPVRADRYGDPLPEGAVFRVGTARLGHRGGGTIKCLAFSADRRLVLSASTGDNTVRVWDCGTGREVRRFATDLGFAVAPDRTTMAVINGNVVRLFRTATGTQLRAFNTAPVRVSAVTLSSDGKVMTALGSKDTPGQEGVRVGVVARWELDVGRKLTEWQHDAEGFRTALSGDGRLVALLAQKQRILSIHEAATGKKLREWEIAGDDDFGVLGFSGDGKLLAASAGAWVRVYETATGTELRAWKARWPDDLPAGGWVPADADAPAISALGFAPGGKRLATVDGDHMLRLWDWASGKLLRRFAGVDGGVAFSADGRVVAAGGHGERVRLWDVATGRDMTPLAEDLGKVISVAAAPDRGVFAVARSRCVTQIIDAGTGQTVRQLRDCTPIDFSPTGHLLVRSGRDLLTLYDATRWKPLAPFRGAPASDLRCVWSKDGTSLTTIADSGPSRYLAATAGSKPRPMPACVWDVRTGHKLHEWHGNGAEVIGCSSDGGTLVMADVEKRTVRILSARAGTESRRLNGCCLFVPISFFRLGGGAVFNLVRPQFIPAILSPDGKLLLTGRDKESEQRGNTDLGGSIVVRETATGRLVYELSRDTTLPVASPFSPDGTLLTVLDKRGDPCLLEAATGRVRHRLTRTKGDLHWILRSKSIAFSRDGRLVCAGYDANTLMLWEVASGRPILTWPGHGGGYIEQAVFSGDGRRLATLGEDGTALVRDVTGMSPDGQLPALKLNTDELEQAWRDLAGSDAAKAHRQAWALVAAPAQAVPLVRERLRRVPGVDARRLARLIADLDDRQFVVREQAGKELERLGELAEPALRRELTQRRSLELRRRVERILERMDAVPLSKDLLRGLRAVAVLEYLGTADARQELRRLAGGAAEARLTREAQSSLTRLARRRGGSD